MKLQVAASLALAAILVAHVQAVPAPQQEVFAEQAEEGGSKTWTAMKNFFRPVKTWFVDELPEKTPGDLYNGAKETAKDVQDWAQEDETIQKLVDALGPIHTWIKDTASTLKDKTFSDMYGDVKDSVAQLDEKVGTWLEKKVAN